jgi:hypothetical protein
LRVPKFLARRSFASTDLTRIIGWVAPKLARVERWSRPRAVRLTRLQARRFLGILILILAGIMALPIPIVGNTPPAIAIILIGFGMIERDGVFVGTGVVVGLIAIGVIIGLAIGFQEALTAYWPAGWWPF